MMLIMLYPLAALAVESNWGSKEVKVGKTVDLTMDAAIMGMTRLSTVTVNSWQWKSNNTSIARVKSSVLYGCTVEGVSEGSTRVYCNLKYTVKGTYYSPSYSIEGYFTIKVTEAQSNVLVTSVTLSVTSVSLTVGETNQLSATVSPGNATDRSVTWSSSNTSVASVNSSGLVTAKGAGSATITCKANDGSGKQATCSVSVSAAAPIKVSGITLNYTSTSLTVGETRQLNATISPSDATDKSVTWSSSNTSVASVNSSGLVTANGRGTATITCKANDGSSQQATCEVTVASIKNYSYFTAKTIEGVEMEFYVSDVSSGVCDVGGRGYSSPAISLSTTGKITIPSEVEGLKVTRIYDYSFRNCTGITEVEVPSSVETIGYDAFYGCTGLKTASLGNGVKMLDSYVFYGCTSLQTITGISKLESIGSYAFNVDYSTYIPWYNSLPEGVIYLGKVLHGYKGSMPEGTTLNVPQGTTQIAYQALRNQAGLVAIAIPSSVTKIANDVLSGCNNLKTITVATSNDKFDSRDNCNAIIETATNKLVAGCKNADIPSTVTTIGYDAFYNISSLTSISIPGSVTVIEGYAFYGTGLTTAVIPSSVDSIGYGAFSYCYSLESVVVGKGLRKMNGNPFYGCRSLQSISVATNNPYFDSRNNCNGILETATNKLVAGCGTTVIPTETKSIGQFALCYNYDIFTLTIPNQVEKLEDYSIESLYGLRSVTIGKGVKDFGRYNFAYCGNLRAIHCLSIEPVDLDESVFRHSSNIPDSIFNSATLYVPIGSKVNYMTTVGWNKFKKIVEIADDAVAEGMVFTVPSIEGVPLSYIVTDATTKTCELIGVPMDANGKVTIPATADGFKVTSIGYDAFYQRNIIEIVIPEGVKKIDSYAFGNLPITSVTLPNSLETINGAAFARTAVKSVNIPKGVVEISGNPFWGCIELETITVDTSNSFYEVRDNCNGVVEKATNKLVIACRTTTIPNSIEEIGASAFSNQSGLTSITIPNSVKVIGGSAFSTTGLTTVTIPASVTKIGSYAFASNYALTSVTSQIVEPFEIDTLVFSNYNSTVYKYYFTDATLYVPVSTKAKYQTKEGWNRFKNIVEKESQISKGTADNPFTPAEANVYGNSLATNEQSQEDCYIRGIVSSIREQFGTQYGNATFYISADGSDNNQFYIYRALYLDNTKYAGQDLQLRVGDEVVVCGKITNYQGTLPETVQNQAYVVSINGVTSGIGDITMDSNSESTVYSLSGQRLQKPHKGLNIIGGKKVVMK